MKQSTLVHYKKYDVKDQDWVDFFFRYTNTSLFRLLICHLWVVEPMSSDGSEYNQQSSTIYSWVLSNCVKCIFSSWVFYFLVYKTLDND